MTKHVQQPKVIRVEVRELPHKPIVLQVQVTKPSKKMLEIPVVRLPR